MVPTTKEALRKLVTDTTIEIYEDLTPQLIQMIDQTKHDEKLTEAQKQDEISPAFTRVCKILYKMRSSSMFLPRFWDWNKK